MRLLMLVCVAATCATVGCTPANRQPPEYAVSWGHRLEGLPCFTFYTDEAAPLFGDQTTIIEFDPQCGIPLHLNLKNHTGQNMQVAKFGDAWGELGMGIYDARIWPVGPAGGG